MRTCLFVILASTFAATANAADWPGAAPCDTTLQACINAQPAAGNVRVLSNAVIDESLLVNKPFNLFAAPGYRPVLEANRSIGATINVAGAWAFALEGFTLRRGAVNVNVNGGSAPVVSIRRVRVLETNSTGGAQISIFNNADSTLIYEVAFNELNHAWSVSDGALRAALQVLDRGTGTSLGRIRENRVVATGSEAIGILISTQDRDHVARIYGNHVLGGNRGSILLRQGSVVSDTGGTLEAFVVSNVVRPSTPGGDDADGIRVDLIDGSGSAAVLHNTVIEAQRGVDLLATSGASPISGQVRGNLFAAITLNGISRGGAFTTANSPDSGNLFFDTSDLPAGVGPGSIFADPLLRGPGDPHLGAGSPAIDAIDGSALAGVIAAEALPSLDADGLRRIKPVRASPPASPADIGALEYGDFSLLFTVPSGAGISAPFPHAAISGNPQAYPQVTANWNPDDSAGTYANHGFSLPYGGTDWSLRRENLMPLVAGSDFNVFAPAAGAGRYRHANTGTSIIGDETLLSQAGLNNQASRIVLATRDPLGSPTVSDLVSPIAVRYITPAWGVIRQDGNPMPASGGFHIYFQEPSFNAFVHSANAGNSFLNVTRIDHRELNGRRCARIHVTQGRNGPINNHHIGVFYTGQQWAIFNQDLAAVPDGAQFHVVVDGAASECPDRLLADGFESP